MSDSGPKQQLSIADLRKQKEAAAAAAAESAAPSRKSAPKPDAPAANDDLSAIMGGSRRSRSQTSVPIASGGFGAAAGGGEWGRSAEPVGTPGKPKAQLTWLNTLAIVIAGQFGGALALLPEQPHLTSYFGLFALFLGAVIFYQEKQNKWVGLTLFLATILGSVTVNYLGENRTREQARASVQAYVAGGIGGTSESERDSRIYGSLVADGVKEVEALQLEMEGLNFGAGVRPYFGSLGLDTERVFAEAFHDGSQAALKNGKDGAYQAFADSVASTLYAHFPERTGYAPFAFSRSVVFWICLLIGSVSGGLLAGAGKGWLHR